MKALTTAALLGLLCHCGFAQEVEKVGTLIGHDLLERDFNSPGSPFARSEKSGSLRISGSTRGVLLSETAFGEFHLVVEFQWGERTFGPRADRARSCEILLPGAVRLQLLESLSGDLWLNDERKKNSAWNEDWKDKRGWHSRAGRIENPFGHWNQLEVIRRGDSLTVILNGTEVNSVGSGLKETEGKIGIRGSGAECRFRKLTIYPLDTFSPPRETEKKTSPVGTDFPREFPLSAEASSKSWDIDGDFQLELVASEPLVSDPVDIAWDGQGRMLVAEMRDYPLPPDEGGNLSRIRLLTDRDGDGRMDEAKVWADKLDHVQGLLYHNGGLVATTRIAVLFLKDTDGDDVADEISELFKINAPRNVQLQIASPHWGVDNMIYFNNGLDLREIYPDENPAHKMELWNSNLRFNPGTGRIEPVSGFGQFGACQDDWGRRFFCSNQNPAMTAVMPLWAVHRNPFDHITEGHEDIAPSGRDARVYPHDFSYTSSTSHAGTNTSACGLVVYRGDAVSELRGDLFVCEPTGQLVTRFRLRENGASFVAGRVGVEKDFLVSSDEWCRPVNLRTGPDGCLYVCDMYRRFIDHARFFPEGFPDSHYMRAGFDQGRIYRLIKKGSKRADGNSEPGRELVQRLASENAWQRIHAQDEIVSGKKVELEAAIRKLLESSENPRARLHALWTLAGLERLSDGDIANALKDRHPGVIENAIMLHDPEVHGEQVFEIGVNGTGRARFRALLDLGDDPRPRVTRLFESLVQDPELRKDPWLRAAVLSGSIRRTGEILSNVSRKGFEEKGAQELVREFSSAVAAQGVPKEIAEILRTLDRLKLPENRFALAEGLAEGLRQSPIGTPSLASFVASPPPLCKDHVGPLQALIKEAEKNARDENLPVADRVAALSLAGEQSPGEFLPTATILIMASSAPSVSRATMNVLRQYHPQAIEEMLYGSWGQLSLETRQEAISILSSGKTVVSLLKRIQSGEIDPLLVDSVQRWNFAQSENPAVVKMAGDLFGTVNKDRAAVISRYRVALNSEEEPDLENGRRILNRAGCLACHRVGDKGVKVGPDLTNFRAKAAETILTDILDPNRMVSRNWMGLSVSTVDGAVYTGIVNGDGNTTLTLDLPGGFSQTIQRNRIENVRPVGVSLMPSGFENAISEQEMRDLIFFLKQN